MAGQRGAALADPLRQLGPRPLHAEVSEEVVGDGGRHPGLVARLLRGPQPVRGSGMAELLEDERVVRRRPVEADHGANRLPPSRPLLVGVADGGEQRHEDRERRQVAITAGRARGQVREQRVPVVRDGVEGMDADAVAVLPGHAQHPRVDGGDVDGRVGG